MKRGRGYEIPAIHRRRHGQVHFANTEFVCGFPAKSQTRFLVFVHIREYPRDGYLEEVDAADLM